MGWELVTINSIVLDSSPVTLTSTNVTNDPNSNYGPVIAGISLVDPVPDNAPVPEPTSMVLLGAV